MNTALAIVLLFIGLAVGYEGLCSVDESTESGTLSDKEKLNVGIGVCALLFGVGMIVAGASVII